MDVFPVRTRVSLLALGLCGVLLAGCGEDADSSADESGTVTETVTATESVTESAEESATAPSATMSPDESEQDARRAAGLPPRPRRGECVEIRVPRDGRYTVYDAGTALVRRDGDVLRLDAADAARGWRARVTDRGGDDDDVEVDFRPRNRGAVLELEVEIDDGGVESQICADDRDDRDD